MSQEAPPGSNSVIRISKSDVDSQHVDDLLKRQASLRGETGITRDTGRRWYYQNWFVLMIAGLLCAALSWAILRPIITDEPYVEGPIEAITPPGPTEPSYIGAHIKMGDMDYPVITAARGLDRNGKWSPLDFTALEKGQQVGLYVNIPSEKLVAKGEPEIYVKYVDLKPRATGPSDLKDAIWWYKFGFQMFFPLAAGLVGLGIGAADGIMCRLPRRIFLAGGIGLIVGLIGGFVSSMLAGILYNLIAEMAMNHPGGGAGGLSTAGFLLQIVARSLGWALAGTTMGLGQGLALRSGRVVLYGLLGGLIGGLFGGILFDPIDFMLRGEDSPAAHISRLVSLCTIGLSVGAMIGIVELLARDAWLRMVAGPLAGKEFLIFKNTMAVGASPKSDIYLFNDPGVAAQHAIVRSTGDTYEIEGLSDVHPVSINGRMVKRSRLRHGDQISLGRTIFVFQRKTG